jgi:predicted secreted Zn-dependent protease
MPLREIKLSSVKADDPQVVKALSEINKALSEIYKELREIKKEQERQANAIKALET